MIYKNTYLILADNSGPKKIKCLNVSKKKIGFLADLLVVVIKKKFLKKKKIKKNILKCIIINVKWKSKRKNGSFLKFKKNKGLLLNNNLIFIGTNVKSIICREIKIYKKQFKKIISYSPGNV